jgi:hypothetical protein
MRLAKIAAAKSLSRFFHFGIDARLFLGCARGTLGIDNP